MKTKELFWDQLATEYGEEKVKEVRKQAKTYFHYLLSRNWFASLQQLVANEGGEESMIRAAACRALISESFDAGFIEWSKELTKEYRLEKTVQTVSWDEDILQGFLADSSPALSGGPIPTREANFDTLRAKLTDKEYKVATTVASTGGKTEAGQQLGMSQHAVSETLRRIRKRLPNQGDQTYQEYRSAIGTAAVKQGNHNRYHQTIPNPFCNYCKPRPVA